MNESKIPAKRWLRIIPICLLMYTIAAIDRTNMGFGFSGIQKDLGINTTYAGLAGGIFNIGYLLLMIHGGIWAERWSVKKFVTIQLVFWGVFASLTGAVHTLPQLLTMRFLTGVAESGVWPATLILLARFFPQSERSRANAYFMLCFPIGAILMSPLSGFILDRWNWRMMFVLEGLPAIFWAAVWWFTIDEHPQTAKWLSAKEQNYIVTTIDAERKNIKKQPKNYAEAFKNRNVWLLVSSLFFWNIGVYGYMLWLPSVLKSLSRGNNTKIGILAALPWVWAILASILIAKHSDKTGDRIHHAIWCNIAGGICLLISTLVGGINPTLSLVALILCMGFIWSYNSLAYAIPTDFLSGNVLGASLGLMTCGNLGGFFGPFIFGYLKTLTGSFVFGMIFLVGALFISGLLLTLVRSEAKVREAVSVCSAVAGQSTK